MRYKNCLPCAGRFVVGCTEFDWVLGCGLGWFVVPKFLLCDGLRWVGSVVWWVGLGWVGLKKLDPRTTLRRRAVERAVRQDVQLQTKLDPLPDPHLSIAIRGKGAAICPFCSFHAASTVVHPASCFFVTNNIYSLS